MNKKYAASLSAATIALSGLALVALPAQAAPVTQTAQCTDGGGHVWKARTTWGDVYTASDGVRRVQNDSVGFTSAAPDATTVDYSVRMYSGTGSLIGTQSENDRVYNFAGGTSYLTRNPVNPPAGSSKARVVLSLGDGNDGYGNCTVTFYQPVAATPTPAPTTASPTQPATAPYMNLWRTPQPQNNLSGDAKFEKWKQVPNFYWTRDWNKTPQSEVANLASQANSQAKILPLVLYAFPRTGYSGGGFNTFDSYKAWVDQVSNGVGSNKAIIAIEPDGLGLPQNMADGTTPAQAVAYVVSKFKASNPNTQTYIEASHWVGVTEMVNKLKAANIANATGFVTNVSAFETNDKLGAWSEQIVSNLANQGIAGKKYLIDTGRNGNGPLTTSYPGSAPWFEHDVAWLNPPGRGAGISPRLMNDARFPNWYAAVWVKNAGGSDGN